MRGYMFVVLLVGDEVLALLETFDLELVALGSLVDVLDVVCKMHKHVKDKAYTTECTYQWWSRSGWMRRNSWR